MKHIICYKFIWFRRIYDVANVIQHQTFIHIFSMVQMVLSANTGRAELRQQDQTSVRSKAFLAFFAAAALCRPLAQQGFLPAQKAFFLSEVTHLVLKSSAASLALSICKTIFELSIVASRIYKQWEFIAEAETAMLSSFLVWRLS